MRFQNRVARVRVVNVGRTAARDCKAYIAADRTHIISFPPSPDRMTAGTIKRRVRWIIPNSGIDVVINSGDEELLDFCALPEPVETMSPQEGDLRKDRETEWPILPNERRWLSIEESRRLNPQADCMLIITSSNATPVERRVGFFREEPRMRLLGRTRRSRS